MLHRKLSRFSSYNWATLAAFLVFASTFALYAWCERQIGHAQAARRHADVLSDQVRHSSDDLTRMARSYVVTGDPRYKKHYEEILAIRDGASPRPVDYERIYWDLVGPDGLRPRPMGAALPLLELLRTAGFTQEELARLTAAKASSDAITRLELDAMALLGSQIPVSESLRATAIGLLFDSDYHEAKARIMRPISAFIEMSDRRALESIEHAGTYAFISRTALILSGALLVALLLAARSNLRATLGGTANELQTRIDQLGSGEFSKVIPVPPGMENSVAGLLSETYCDLARIDAQRKRAEAEVEERRKELGESVLASMNMMEDAVRQRENAERAYAELERTHKQLIEASRQRGMAEVATNVLHNVGNVLNSVNVSASLVVETVRNSRAANMAKVVALLREHEADLGVYITTDPRGKHIPVFLGQLADDWQLQQESVIKELESLRSNIDHIKEIVVMQQNHAKVIGTAELVRVTELVEDSLRMNEDSLTRHDIRVVREFHDVPAVRVEKHKVLQILVNLMRNAKDACHEQVGEKVITLRVAQVDGRIRISVGDNGAGIAPQNLTRIFAHGFTTRKDGHGFGLHSGALAATELGGGLSAHSDGLGMGATFTLELAREPPAAFA